ncbi:hypothetical protein [Candidatus Nanohalococcus occultus]|uniref:Transcriptional regulator, contains HTH domain n=1 Tax=Candidatus Nanohalococcus occultus TaxID=2978047 RepID=A0ABY8CEC6_9ARCH|nr:Transcriptional regulator, contains HTH domain [Candidatus Nanohaloarchaeota archaeon SVXNc]
MSLDTPHSLSDTETQSGEESRIDKLRKIHDTKDNRSEDILVLDSESYSKITTKERLKMIKALREKEFDSKKELAEELGRDVKNIHDDLDLLRRKNVVEFESNGRSLSPRLRHQHIAGEII